jgi:3-deoxy-7-phosphoheptulonate synthase
MIEPSLTDDLRIEKIRNLISPSVLMEELPLSVQDQERVADARQRIAAIVHGRSQRLLVVAGPCSIHDQGSALEYASLLKAAAERHADALEIVMRVYFEKPRTTVGWKGFINDPYLDGSFDINRGLHLARQLLVDVTKLGLPIGTEFLDTITPQYIADAISWGAIGARTTESQIHRQLASGLSMPTGFKNGTDGNVAICVDAIRAAHHPHHFLSVTKQGIAAIVETRGNQDCHVILRGSSAGTNYDHDSITNVGDLLKAAGLSPLLMVDCSHGNSSKRPELQIEVARSLADQIGRGELSVMGTMIESHLVPGRQDPQPGSQLTYGQSITDACIGWGDTEDVFELLADAVRLRS